MPKLYRVLVLRYPYMPKETEGDQINEDIEVIIEEEDEEISEVAYRMFLLEMRTKFQGRVNHMKYLLEKLEEARDESRLNIYCYESEDDVQMITVEKGGIGFGVKRQVHVPPEGYEEITDIHYETVLKQARDNAQEQVEELEHLLTALDEATQNSALRLRFFRGPTGVRMEMEEKGPLGFKLKGRGS
jgi:hypothetical protein